MKITLLFCAGAMLLLDGNAAAQSGVGVQAQKPASARQVKKPRAAPTKQKDPYAAYWDDASRRGPPSSYFRGGGL